MLTPQVVGASSSQTTIPNVEKIVVLMYLDQDMSNHGKKDSDEDEDKASSNDESSNLYY